jgi:GAF domain-containing protein
MYKPLHSFYPDPAELLALKPNDFGDLIVLELWGDNEKLNRNNFANDARNRYPMDYQDRITRAAMEAWGWLVNQQLIAETSENGWFFLTRLGEERRAMLTKLRDEAKDANQQRDDPPRESSLMPESSELREIKVRDETIFDSTVGDQPTREDSLGFEPYVRAVADFLTNPLTVPPLTISIEGDWGAGKSSFMAQLLHLLESRNNLTISFNAWRHDKHEELWAAFALEFIRQISAKQPFIRRWWANLTLRRKRFDWAEGWLDLIRTVGAWTWLIALAIGLPLLFMFKGSDWIDSLNNLLTDGSVAGIVTGWFLTIGGSVVALTSLFMKLKNILGNPVTIDLRKHLKSPKYEERVAFIENFHRDLDRIVRSYVGGRKVFIFIDDLDRCEVPKAAELMQAINLMIADNPQLIFVVGMDREKIAAGIAVKHEKLIPFLTSSLDEADNDGKRTALYYGYRFIEKFIQIPFTVPSATVADLERFFRRLNLHPEPKLPPHHWRRFMRRLSSKEATIVEPVDSPATASSIPALVTEEIQRRQQMLKLIRSDEESEAIQHIVVMAAVLLERNPRRLKQFINLFRLRAHIANETGLFDVVAGGTPSQTLTLEQLGKFVAITLMHPRILFDLETDDQLIAKLQLLAANKALPEGTSKGPLVECWEKSSRLMSFLRYGVSEGNQIDRDRFSLEILQVSRLLAISPRVRSSASIAAATQADESPSEDIDERERRIKTRAVEIWTEMVFRQLTINQEFNPRLTLFALNNSFSPAKLVQIARYSWRSNTVGRLSISAHKGVAGRSVSEKKAILVDDVHQSADLGFSPEELADLNSDVASVACVPIIANDHNVVGVLALDVNAPKVIDDKHLRILMTASSVAASLI